MKTMSPKAQRWLKIVHILLAALWLASAIILVLVPLVVKPDKGNTIYGVMLTLKFIDDFVIIPAANGCLLTGLIYSIWTHWGFFKHRWILVKWIITLYGIIVGTIWLGPWMNAMTATAGEIGSAALSDPVFMDHRFMNILWGGIQATTLLFALTISILKPWKKQSKPT